MDDLEIGSGDITFGEVLATLLILAWIVAMFWVVLT